MMRLRWYYIECCLLAFLAVGPLTVQAASVKVVDFGGERWEQIRGKHFLLYYHPNWSAAKAQEVLRLAERYYQEIAETLGFTRYSDFWTWDDRAKIFIFPSQEVFSQKTGAPAWTTGYSDRDSFLFQSRAIVTYQQEAALAEEILPHEVSHLILHDFIPEANLPVWIDEGIAQLFEKEKVRLVDRVMSFLVTNGQFIDVEFLNRWNIRKEHDGKKIEVFYVQSLSIIKFMREEYGHSSFQEFCRHLRDGKDINSALRAAYTGKIHSLKDLEREWLKYIRNKQ
ncbi:MAG TPA: hypothetical protein VLJ10_05150 [Candidatus Bathyarchaeia archaeon]|nr:hypothetical protein [Candidatus Bathyarchaeia archaeon]